MTTLSSRTNTITHAGGVVVRRPNHDAEYLLLTASAQFSPNTPAMLVAS